MVHGLVLGDEFGDRVEGVPGADEQDAVRERVGFNVVLPEVRGEFFAFAAGEVGGRGGIFDRARGGYRLYGGVVSGGLCAVFGFYGGIGIVEGGGGRVLWPDGDKLGDVHIDDAVVLRDGPLDVRLCAVNLVGM